MVVKMFLSSQVTILMLTLKFCLGVEIYGDIYPNTRADLQIYYKMPNRENKCYKDVPSVLYQTQEHEFVQGNASTPDFFRLEVCCDGYKRAYHRDGQCVPDCSKISPDNCRHGFCRSPYHCECFEGFVKNAEGKCVHTCPVTCENGRCLLDGTCICNPGYGLDPETRKYCIPDCSHIPCGLNQRCLAPGQCGCAKGYESLEGLGCQPICRPHCGLGRCVAPGECECFAGFVKRLGRSICEAECLSGCGPYGHCIAPNVCACGPGRQLCLAGGKCSSLGKCYCPPTMSHFIDRCIYSTSLTNAPFNSNDILYYDKEMKREFHALVGRLFEFPKTSYSSYNMK